MPGGKYVRPNMYVGVDRSTEVADLPEESIEPNAREGESGDLHPESSEVAPEQNIVQSESRVCQKTKKKCLNQDLLQRLDRMERAIAEMSGDDRSTEEENLTEESIEVNESEEESDESQSESSEISPAIDRQILLQRLERMERTVFEMSERQRRKVCDTTVPPWLTPRAERPQSSNILESSAPCQPKTDNMGGIRLDIRGFPQGIPTSKLWTEWCRYKSNFDIAMDLNNVSSTNRAKLLYLYMGDQLQGLATAAKLCPSFEDPQSYSTLTQNIGTYLRSLIDTTAEHEEFTRLRQESTESVVAFYARVVEKAGLCGYGDDENRFVRSQILQGMSNRDVANAARTYNHDIQTFVQAATRAEAFNLNAGPSKAEGIMEVTRKPTNHQSGQKRSTPAGWNAQGRNHFNEPPSKRNDNQGRSVGKHHRCFRCDRPKHNGSPCPALFKHCYTCGERGHFSVTCRKKRVNNVNT